MQELYSLVTAIAVSFVVSTAILLALVKPLRQVLGLICQGGESTSFWVSFTTVMLYATPLFFAVLWTPFYDVSSISAIRTAVLAALFGSIGGVIIIGLKIAGARKI
jgi:hypothetical protein